MASDPGPGSGPGSGVDVAHRLVRVQPNICARAFVGRSCAPRQPLPLDDVDAVLPALPGLDQG